MAEQTKVKRPEKKVTVHFILSQFAALQAGVPGVTLDTVKGQLDYGNYYLYQSEVDKIVEEKQEEADFDTNAFVEMLKYADAVKQGSAPRLTDGITRINSRERALEVANDPENDEEVKSIQEIMTAMLKLRDKLNPLVSENATCSIALKNKKSGRMGSSNDNEDNEDNE